MSPVQTERHRRAQSHWPALYRMGVAPLQISTFPRDATDIGDPRALPYLKDLLAVALKHAALNDVILWSNDDCWFDLSRLQNITDHAKRWGAVSMRRRESRGPDYCHVGRECLAFSGLWLVENIREIPDYILAASDFDLGLAALIRHKLKRLPSSLSTLMHDIHPCEVPRGFCLHEPHKSAWETDDVDSRPSTIHNRKLFREWAAKNQPVMKFSPSGCLR
jgi:hypothetical protein